MKSDNNYLLIKEQTNRLVDSIQLLSNNLPNPDFLGIKSNLISSIRMMPDKIEQGLRPNRKIDKVRSLIKATGALSEIKDYLSLVEELNYGETKDIINQLESVSAMLTSDYPTLAI